MFFYWNNQHCEHEWNEIIQHQFQMMWKLMIKCSKLWNEKKDRHAISLSHTYLFKLKASMPHKLSLQAFNTRTVFLTKSNSNKHDSYMCTLSGNSRLFTCSTSPSISPSEELGLLVIASSSTRGCTRLSDCRGSLEDMFSSASASSST